MNTSHRVYEALAMVTTEEGTYPAYYDEKRRKLGYMRSKIDEDHMPLDELVQMAVGKQTLWFWKDEAECILRGQSPQRNRRKDRYSRQRLPIHRAKVYYLSSKYDIPDPIGEIERAEATIAAQIGVDMDTMNLVAPRRWTVGDADEALDDPFNGPDPEDYDEPDTIPGGPNARLI